MTNRVGYIKEIRKSLQTAWKGLTLTWSHFRRGKHKQQVLGIDQPGYFEQAAGPVTVLYPAEKVPVPDNGRYRLHMETDDCIGCDKCARICPVDCITIETFKADGDLGKTSDGTVKRLHLPVFDIDMAKCMYCGLCTTVCPTECLTMTKVYDFSEYDRDNFVYHFGAYSPEEEVRIRAEVDLAKNLKTAQTEPAPEAEPEVPVRRRPVMRKPAEEETSAVPPTPESDALEKPKTFRPRPLMKQTQASESPSEPPSLQESKPEPPVEDKPATPRPRPVFKRPTPDSTPES